MAAYYNENDLFAAEWLRNLVLAGLIADGEVDTRSIEDVTADDLKGFQQCHFFAGIGVWSHALRNAGWPDDRVVWTGSCPCQPFSAAGKRGGTADERHLWPAFFHLIEECRPPVVLGEQVASKDGLAWLDLVSADMEGAGYAFGAVDTCAAGFGAPHIRQRLWFTGIYDTAGTRQFTAWERAESETWNQAWLHGPECRRGADGMAEPNDAISESESGRGIFGQRQGDGESAGSACERPEGLCTNGRLADGDDTRLEGRRQPGRGCAAECAAGPGVMAGRLEHVAGDGRIERRPEPGQRGASGRCGTSGLGNASSSSRAGRDAGTASPEEEGCSSERSSDGVECSDASVAASPVCQRPGPLNGFWRDADWLLCRDGRWRPVEPCTFPLAHGIANRVGLLRGAGNAIVAEQAQGFIEAVMDALGRP